MYSGVISFPPVEGVNVPVITAYQAEVVLTEAGLFDGVKALIEHPDTPARIKIAWQRGLDIRRDNPMVALIIDQLGLSNEQVDALFESAQGITAGAL
jgi:hypothetical protein